MHEFLRCRTPAQWVEAAVADLTTLLRDHAALELKAAQQAQKLIWRYGMRPTESSSGFEASLRAKLSRLAREELRHFELLLTILERRGIAFVPVSASRYAATLHAQIAEREPDTLVDTLIVGAIIEARSCERFEALVPVLQSSDSELATFYASLLKSEERHFLGYLELARAASAAPVEHRIAELLDLEHALVTSDDTELRFHSGIVPRT